MGPDSIVDKPGGPKPWSERARRSWQAWRNCYPSLAYARGDPHTFYVDIDRAADMAGLTRANFYRRYLLSNQLPYVVKTWFHGHRRRYQILHPAQCPAELLAGELCEVARMHTTRRGRQAIQRKATAADLERLLDQKLPKLG